MNDFWKTLPKPFFCLAPMEDVTDFAFREMFARYSAAPETDLKEQRAINPFVMFTEFVNVDGLLHPEGQKKLLIDLKYSPIQRPIVAQLWGNDPEKFYEAAKLIQRLGFDGIDINMGCPQDKEIAQNTCAALIRNPALAKEIILAAKKGAGTLPLSVKTRIGYSKPETESWIGFLLATGALSAITIHGRTKQEKSKVPAHWDEIEKAVKIRSFMQVSLKPHNRTVIIGNGDIKTYPEGLLRIKQSGVDGVMVGRGAFGNPWFFSSQQQPSVKQRLLAMQEHIKLFEREFADLKPFKIMRKHFKAYVSGFKGAAELRAKLMETSSLKESEKILQNYFLTLS
jgi:nifR3 family TIM-barrel protein